jgi:hypothetical protein
MKYKSLLVWQNRQQKEEVPYGDTGVGNGHDGVLPPPHEIRGGVLRVQV